MISSKTSKELYQEYKELAQKAADLNYASAVLGWDQEVFMPEKGFEHRGRQLATLGSMSHDIVTSERYGNILTELSGRGDLSEAEADNIRLSKEDHDKHSKVPAALVEKISMQISKSYSVWIQARRENNYSIYAPELEKMLALKKEEAEHVGYKEHVYDAMLDDYEKGATVSMLNPIFDEVKATLPSLLDKIKAAPQVDDAFLKRNYPRQGQWDFSMDVLKSMGYDLSAGRQDISEHPFTTSFSPQDVRVTTRVDENDFASLLWSSIHEGGHALYEQGLSSDYYGLPLGEAASLSIHESQSRLWENSVGRALPFWKYFYPKLQQYFGTQLSNVSLEDFYKGMNKVVPSLIRTESDELTYHFHVMIRYEVEKAMVDGTVAIKDLSAYWNEMYQKYLGVSADNDKEGVLQDVHWAHGSFGYFPTYSLGSFYAAQFYQQATKEISGLEQKIQEGEFGELLQWLRKGVHQYGRKYRSEELCQKLTGQGLSFTAFMDYATEKYTGIYGL